MCGYIIRTNKLPVSKMESRAVPVADSRVKRVPNVWCLWAGNWKQKYNHWAAIPIIGPMQPEWYWLQRSSGPLAKLTLVLSLDEVYMSLLRVVLQAHILTTASDRLLGREKVMQAVQAVQAVQWAISAMGDNQLAFKATTAVFGYILARESSTGLDSTVLTEFGGSAMESDVL